MLVSQQRGLLDPLLSTYRMQLAPPGNTRVPVHVKPSARSTWSPHAVSLDSATNRYRCYRFFIWDTSRERISDTLVHSRRHAHRALNGPCNRRRSRPHRSSPASFTRISILANDQQPHYYTPSTCQHLRHRYQYKTNTATSPNTDTTTTELPRTCCEVGSSPDSSTGLPPHFRW
jgi:hypothetical protein